ncbi:MAG: DUF58 domain-containing protein [Solirubrobacteraceae bacterium]|nr:DUF58 domain-containing protein [Solirubrobacteraceae bacterium]
MKRGTELAIGPVLLAVAAVLLGSLAIFAIAVGLALIYIGAAWAVSRAEEQVRIARQLLHHEIVEGRRAELQFETTGVEGLPVTIEYACQCGEWHTLPAGRHTVGWTMDHPGPHVVGPSPLRIRDDLGLFTRFLFAGEPDRLLVLPDPEDVNAHRRVSGSDMAHDPEPDGLREYVRGTPMSRIHWKTAARTGQLMERRFVTSRDELPLIIVDTAGALTGANVDWAAREAAGQALALARSGGCRVLLPGDRTPTTLLDPVGSWTTLHRRLADLAEGRPTLPHGVHVRDAVVVAAAAAPPHRVRPRRALPPGFVGEGVWAGR